jgi:hypothetical protein
MRLAFADTETITLEPGHDVMWEIAVITRDGDRASDREWTFQLRPNMAKAQPEALEISGFKARYLLSTIRAPALGWSELNGAEPAKLTRPGLALSLHTLLDGRSIFGICPSFDTLRLSLFLRRQFRGVAGYTDPFHYQPHDVEDEVAGYLRGRDHYEHAEQSAVDPAVFAIPRPTELLAQAAGVTLKPEDKHTALGDARFARDLHDAVNGAL